MYTRLFEAVQRIATQTGKEKGRIYDTLTGDLEHLIDTLPELNFMGDPDLDALIKDCRKIAVDPDMLRAEEGARNRVHRYAQEILSRMAGFM